MVSIGGVDDPGDDHVLVVRGEGQHDGHHQEAGGEEPKSHKNYCILRSLFGHWVSFAFQLVIG